MKRRRLKPNEDKKEREEEKKGERDNIRISW